MKRLLLFCLLTALSFAAYGGNTPSRSVYTQRPDDGFALYFTPEHYGIRADGRTDVSDALQSAINELKTRDNFGILFIPEGKYLISKTIYIPTAVRLIGYGKTRPEIILADNAPGFQTEPDADKGKARYMFWFTSSVVREGGEVRDAGAGTFYSALSNIDLRIGKGNPAAVALRTHYAQHSFISHCDIHVGDGKAGLFDVGNEMEDVRFFGGDYGIYTTKTSPSWQFTMLNTVFEGQRKAAILTEEGGWVIRRMEVRNVPVGIELVPARGDKIYLEGCRFENVRDAAVVVSNENRSPNQLTVRNTGLGNVPTVIRFRESGETIPAAGKNTLVRELTYGLHMDSMVAEPEFRTAADIVPVRNLPDLPENDIPALPDMSVWTNVTDLGAVGDNETDNTAVLQKAVDEHDVLYFPQGYYRLTGTLRLRKNTVLIGLNPVSTQLVLHESTPAFSGFGGPVALLESSRGGDDIVSGLAIDTGAYNHRAVGCKWMAGARSYLNDVKFVGGHGVIRKPSSTTAGQRVVRTVAGVSTPDAPVVQPGKDKAWDNQHWSLWITDGGGGTFKDIWSADTYSASGILVSNTSTSGRMYEISVEHHVRNEVTFRNVSNWEIYALQLEEELRESPDVQQIEIQDCRDLLFANLYLFRVIWIETPLPQAIRLWGDNRNLEFYNVHNFTQMRFTADHTVYDVNRDLAVLPWEFTRLTVRGDEPAREVFESAGFRRIATGFEHLEGLAADSKGNVYFCEQRMRRIYRLDAATGLVTLVTDLPWQVLSLACDTEDRLLVCVRYAPQPGNAAEPRVRDMEDKAGTTFWMWGNNVWEARVYAIDPTDPENSFTELPRIPAASAGPVSRLFLPSHRWRDLHDFDAVSVSVPQEVFMAPDGKTVIPDCYDLLRSSGLVCAEPGKPVYTVDEYDHRTVRMTVDPDGSRKNYSVFAPFGACGAVGGPDGRVWVADGFLYVFDSEGNRLETLRLPWRPTSLVFGGAAGDRLFVAAGASLYEYIQ